MSRLWEGGETWFPEASPPKYLDGTLPGLLRHFFAATAGSEAHLSPVKHLLVLVLHSRIAPSECGACHVPCGAGFACADGTLCFGCSLVSRPQQAVLQATEASTPWAWPRTTRSAPGWWRASCTMCALLRLLFMQSQRACWLAAAHGLKRAVRSAGRVHAAVLVISATIESLLAPGSAQPVEGCGSGLRPRPCLSGTGASEHYIWEFCHCVIRCPSVAVHPQWKSSQT